MELLAGIVALIVVMVGIITFGEGGYHWLSSMVEAAANAGEQAISDQSVGTAGTQPFVMDWDKGKDDLAYTMDDKRTDGDWKAFLDIAQNSLSPSSPQTPPRIKYMEYDNTHNTYTYNILNNFVSKLDATTTQGWLIGQSLPNQHQWALGRIDRQDGRAPIDFGDAFQSLVYGSDSIKLQSEVYLPPLSNLQ